MYENLSGKRLLFLGGIGVLSEAVQYAREMGIYTIVTDYLPDSPAKKFADKSCMVSITDADALVDLCKTERVDGVFTAFMDEMLPYAKEVCDIMGFPFYASADQIRLSHDKSYFKKICQHYDVPTPKDYSDIIKKYGTSCEDLILPLIIKPVDMASGRGITICRTKSELAEAYRYALEFSPSKRVIVEEYLMGDEVTATYTIKDGEISLSTFRDKLLSKDHANIQTQGDVLVNPSAFLNEYCATTDIAVKRMLEGVGATNGAIFLQGVKTIDKIAFFEMGYRPNGACDYRHISQENGINYMKMMLAHALTGEMQGYDLSMDNPFFSKFSVTFNLWAHPGIIASMDGLQEVQDIPNVTLAEYKADVGFEVTERKPYSQCVFRAIIVDKTIDGIQNSIEKIQSFIKVTDIDGKSMLYKPFDVCRLDGRKLESARV